MAARRMLSLSGAVSRRIGKPMASSTRYGIGRPLRVGMGAKRPSTTPVGVYATYRMPSS